MKEGSSRFGIFTMCLLVLISMLLLTDSSLGEEDQFEAFQKWAVEYAIEQQKASEFQLTPYEEMDAGELRNLIEKEWMEKYNQICPKNPTLDEQEQAIKEYNAALMPFFRESLSNGHHSEAWKYFSLLRQSEEDASLLAASREAYDMYIEGYEYEKSAMEEFVAKMIAAPLDCLPGNGSPTSTQLYLTTEGAKESDPHEVTDLYAGPKALRDWPTFPTLQVTFGLSDGSDSPWTWNNFAEIEIRQWDRTPGDSMRDKLDWMVQRGPYRSIIDEEGLEAAKDAFRENLVITNDLQDDLEAEDQIQFVDLSSFIEVAFVRSPYGLTQETYSFDYLNRCTEVTAEDASSEESLVPCNEVCAAGYQCLTEEEAKKKCSEEKKCCGEPTRDACDCKGKESKFCFPTATSSEDAFSSVNTSRGVTNTSERLAYGKGSMSYNLSDLRKAG